MFPGQTSKVSAGVRRKQNRRAKDAGEYVGYQPMSDFADPEEDPAYVDYLREHGGINPVSGQPVQEADMPPKLDEDVYRADIIKTKTTTTAAGEEKTISLPPAKRHKAVSSHVRMIVEFY